MNKNTILIAAVVTLTASGVAAGNDTTPPPPPGGSIVTLSPEQRAERIKKHREAVYRTTGGQLVKPGSMQGKIRVVLASEDVSKESVLKQHASFARVAKFDFDVISGETVTVDTAMSAKAKINADIVVFVVDGAGSAPMIAAPEEGWAIVNAKACGSATRTEKEVVRALAYIGGAATSSYGVSVMSVSKPVELDIVKEVELPFDVIDRMQKYLKTRGVTPEIRSTYKTACAEGWAPKPTNDVQRAIWDNAYALPDKPIKIKYNAKRDAGK